MVDKRIIDDMHIDQYTIPSWFSGSGSMTAQFESLPMPFSIKLLSQSYALIERQEASALNMTPDKPCLIREILMLADEEPWLLARSVIPEVMLALFNGVIEELGQKALGHVLFSDPDITRSEFEFSYENMAPALLTRYQDICCLVPSTPYQGFLTRRSLFYKKKQALLLTEIALPAMQAYYQE